MPGPQTTRALNDRALLTIKWLNYWTKRLTDEMKSQNISLATCYDEYGLDSDDDEIITLKRGFVRKLFWQLVECEKELQRFARPPKRTAPRRRVMP
jgi:hypothetical protein